MMLDKNNRDGKWIKIAADKYENKQYNPEKINDLFNQIQRKTKWDCLEIQRSYLNANSMYKNVYIYLTKDETGSYANPRLFMASTKIKEPGKKESIYDIKGIEEDCIIEDSMIDILEEKLKEFGDYDRFEKRFYDMKMMKEIKEKHKQGKMLTKEEIIFLYEINYHINCIHKLNGNPMVEKIKAERNIKKDFAYLFDCNENNIGTNLEDLDNNEILVYIGTLNESYIKNHNRLKSIKVVFGDILFNSSINIECFPNLECVYGNAEFRNLENAEGLENLKYVSRTFEITRIDLFEQLKNLELVGERVIVWTYDKRVENKNKKLIKSVY